VLKEPLQNVNPEAQLTPSLAYLVGQGKDIGLDNEKQDAAIRALAAKGPDASSDLHPQQIRADLQAVA
jgi:hypothetical protein